jgi:L-asparagine transporter-like permease
MPIAHIKYQWFPIVSSFAVFGFMYQWFIIYVCIKKFGRFQPKRLNINTGASISTTVLLRYVFL